MSAGETTGRTAARVRGALATALLVPSLLVAACAGGSRGHATPGEITSTAATAVHARAREAVDLGGSWRYLPYSGEGDMAAPSIDDRAWPEMSLPSNWFLLGKKEYPRGATALPRAFGNNAPGELWPVDPSQGFDYAGTVWFRRNVEWSGATGAPAILDLDMVDYYADVFVNGIHVGAHEGYFQHWSVDASRAIHAGSNVIAVKVSAPALTFDMAQQYAVSWPKMQNQVKGIFAYHDTRPGATSWRGQERSTGGILRGVALRGSSGVDLTEITVTPLDVSAAAARLVVEATVQNWSDTPSRVTVDGMVRPASFKDDKAPLPVRFTFEARPGVSRARTEVRITEPRLWWSWDYGTPNLYALDATLRADGRGAGDPPPLDHRAVRFGVRSITRDDGWVFRLNGQRIYPRGSNYIATQWLSLADRAFYERDLRMMIDANLNSIRVHAHLERPELYDLADEMGVMIWQDFPLQWGYTDMPAFHAEAERQAEDMVRQYHDHPSILVWCMHNESPHAMTWMKHKTEGQNLALDDALAALARRLDPSRVVHRDSGTGDGHYYYGWYDGKAGDVTTADVLPFVTEYGAAALPNVETLRTMFDGEALWPRTPKDWETWQFADFQPRNTFGLANVKQGKDLAEFVKNTQEYQANVVRFQTEVLRRRKWTKSTGVYHFMFSDDWPAITWAVVDYYRRPKLALGALRDSMQRLLPSIEYDVHDPRKPVSVHVVNDLLAPVARARVVWRVMDGDARVSAGERQVDVPADGVVRVADLGTIAALSSPRGRLDVSIEDAGGKTLARSSLTASSFIPLRAE
jgi:beta-mannosidase